MKTPSREFIVIESPSLNFCRSIEQTDDNKNPALDSSFSQHVHGSFPQSSPLVLAILEIYKSLHPSCSIFFALNFMKIL